MVENSLLHIVQTGTCHPICSSSTQQSCAADMRTFVGHGSPSTVFHGDRAPSLDLKSRTLFSVVAALLVALLLLMFLTGIRMCVLRPQLTCMLQNSTALARVKRYETWAVHMFLYQSVPLCRKQKRTARMEAVGSRKMLHHAQRQAHEDFYSNQDLSAQLSLAQHSLTQQVSNVAVGAPRRRHPSPYTMPAKTLNTESWNGTSTTAETFSMVLKSTHDAWSTPDKDDYHRGCSTGSTLVRAGMLTHDTPDDPLASPCALTWQCASTEWYGTVTHDSSHLSPPVLARPDGADTGILPHAGGGHSLPDSSSDTFLPLPPLFSCYGEETNW